MISLLAIVKAVLNTFADSCLINEANSKTPIQRTETRGRRKRGRRVRGGVRGGGGAHSANNSILKTKGRGKRAL